VKSVLKKLFKTLAKHAPSNSLRVGLFRACGFRIGKDVYIGEDVIVAEILEDASEKLVLGDRVAVAPRVTFVTSSDPNESRLAPEFVTPVRGRIVVGDDAWIGAGAIILPNVTIGEGGIVGAGAVVTENVSPYSVVAGVPAKAIRHLKRDGLLPGSPSEVANP
jgi:maltose O-acetyltransferase